MADQNQAPAFDPNAPYQAQPTQPAQPAQSAFNPNAPYQAAQDSAQVTNTAGETMPADVAARHALTRGKAPVSNDDAADTGILAGVKRNTVGLVTGLYHAFSDPATDQEKADLMDKVNREKEYERAAGRDPDVVPISLATDPSRATLAYHRLMDAPADSLHKKGEDEQAAAQDLLRNGKTWNGVNAYMSGLVDKGLSAVPLAGPSINAIAERIEKGDVSGGATDLAAMIAAENAPKIARAGGKVIDKATEGLAGSLKASAQRNYEEVLNPTKQTTKFQTQRIMPNLLEERPVAMTQKGLAEKAAGRAEEAGQQIEQTVQNLQGTMQTQPVIDGLQNLKKSFQVKGVSLRPEVDSVIDSVSDQMKAMGPDITLQEAVQARRILDDAVAEAKGYQGTQLSDASLAKIRKEAANSIRSELGQASPDLAAVNAKYHFWNTLNNVMEETIKRKTGQAPSMRDTIRTAAIAGAGMARGGVASATEYAAAMSTLSKLFRSTAWRTVSAATKASLADALASGNFNQVAELASKAIAPAVIAGLGQDKKANITKQPEQKTGIPISENWIQELRSQGKQPVVATLSTGQQVQIHPEDLEELKRRDPQAKITQPSQPTITGSNPSR